MTFKDLTMDNISKVSREELEEIVLKGKDSLFKHYFSAQESLNEAVNRIAGLEKILEVLEAQKKQWEEQQILQQEVVIRQIGNSDNVVRSLQEEISSIKRQLCPDCKRKVR